MVLAKKCRAYERIYIIVACMVALGAWSEFDFFDSNTGADRADRGTV